MNLIFGEQNTVGTGTVSLRTLQFFTESCEKKQKTRGFGKTQDVFIPEILRSFINTVIALLSEYEN